MPHPPPAEPPGAGADVIRVADEVRDEPPGAGADVIRVADEVRDGLASGAPVVALESTVFSELGLPAPANRRCLDRAMAAVAAAGAVPALTGILDGRAVVGADEAEADRLAAGSVKIAARDLGAATARRLPVGVTTVSASVTLAAAVGIEVFATGGLGGVHRGAAVTGDVSQDLAALARHPVIAVSSGVKAFCDLPRTLEHLEALGVPVVGWDTDRFPAFYLRDSGLAAPGRVSGPAEAAALFRAGRAAGHPTGVLVANPVPASAELDPDAVEEAVDQALAAVDQRGLTGPDITPAVLDAIAAATGGASIAANLALVESNAAVAAAIAAALAAGGRE